MSLSISRMPSIKVLFIARRATQIPLNTTDYEILTGVAQNNRVSPGRVLAGREHWWCALNLEAREEAMGPLYPLYVVGPP